MFLKALGERGTAATSAQFFASVRALIGARACLALLQLFSLPLLTRLLDVRDFAVMALGMTIPLFANAFSDAGMGRSLVRRPYLSVQEWSSVFWFLFLVGVGLALCIAAAAPVFANVMGQPELMAVVVVLASVPFLQAVTAAHQSALERDFRFDHISSVRVLAGVVGVFAAVGLAFAGAGVWALVVQHVITPLLRAAGFAWLSSYHDQWVMSWTLLKPHLRFGKNTLLLSGVLTVQTQAPVLAFGQVFGALAVSHWSMSERASQLTKSAFSMPIADVTLVSMSRQWKNGQGAKRVQDLYLSSTQLLTTALMPCILVIALAGEEAFVWALSEPWRPVATVFALAAPGLLIDAISSNGAPVFMVADRTDLRLRMTIERVTIELVLFLAALPLGLEMAILCRSLFALAYLPRYWSYLGRCVPLDRWAAARQLVLPATVGLGVGLWARLWLNPLIPGTAAEALAVLATAAAATGVAAVLSWRPLKVDIARLRASAHTPEGADA